MAVYPTSKVHRVSRRKLGRGQYPPISPISLTVTSSGSTATFTSAVPLVISGTVPVAVAGGPTFISQAIVSPYVFSQTFSEAVATHTYSIPAGATNIRSAQGGVTVGESGTF
jgi:hypothetical protein